MVMERPQYKHYRRSIRQELRASACMKVNYLEAEWTSSSMGDDEIQVSTDESASSLNDATNMI